MEQEDDSTRDRLLAVHEHIHTRMAKILHDIRSSSCHHSVRLDLLSLNVNACGIRIKMDNEMVECRRRGRLTARYESLNSEITELFKILEREIFWQQFH